MTKRHRNTREKLEALTLVAAGFKQTVVGRRLNIPGNTISTWMHRETELVDRANLMAPRAIKMAKRSISARRGGLARWGKLDPMPVPPVKAAKGATPPKLPAAKAAVKGAKRPMSEATKEKLRNHWRTMDPGEKQLRIEIMRDRLPGKKA